MPQSHPAGPCKTGKSVTILMADDDADDRAMTKEAFEEAKLANDLRFVEDGQELLDYLHRRGKYANPASSPLPGLILLDLNMPRKDGREALEELKADPRFKSIRVVVLTTSKAEADIVRSYNLSAASYITKPVTFESLVEVVRTLGKYWLEIVELPSNGDGATDRPVRILLVDDDRDDFFLTKDLLEEISTNRYHLDWAPTFQQGLDAICRNEHDVYILDYQLGDKTGLDLMREARCRGCLGPAILLTGQTNGDVDRAAMTAGAADFLEKARIDATLLERSIRYALEKKRYEAELERKVEERTRELAEANEALRVADLKKDEFLATLAHELRNPLAPIRNAIEIIRLGGDKPETIERARAIMERQVGQLVRLVDDLLDVSRVTRGKLRLNIEKLDIASIMEAAVEISRPNLDQARVQLTVTPPTSPIIVNGDRIRLAQVLSNLLNNAAKFTDGGGKVDLIAEREGDKVAISVRDTGVGIAADLLPQVFDLFTQMDRTVNRSQGGLGIGLALVRRLVEIHGGIVQAKSDGPGKGAEFTVYLPAPIG